MKALASLTKLYFLGNVRRQAHLATLFLGVILLMLPAYVNAFSLGINAFERVSKDFGLTLINYFAIAMSILLASGSIPRDIENRSLYPILARPIHRYQYILAHFLAIVALLSLSLTFLGICMSVSLAAMTQTLDLSLFTAVIATFGQAAIVASVTMAASTVASPALAGTVGVFVFLIGSLPGAFVRFFLVEDRDSQLSANLATALKAALPNLSLFAMKDAVVHHVDYNPAYVPAIMVYAVVWVALSVLVAAVLFGRRDL